MQKDVIHFLRDGCNSVRVGAIPRLPIKTLCYSTRLNFTCLHNHYIIINLNRTNKNNFN